jgi:hypothetical protein
VGNSCGYTNSTIDSVLVFPNDTSVSVVANTLTSNADSPTYQWFDCNTMQIIPWVTSKTFSPSKSGRFAVILYEKNCVDTSTCYSILSTGVEEKISISSIKLFTNPANNHVDISFGIHLKKVAVTITDISGK